MQGRVPAVRYPKTCHRVSSTKPPEFLGCKSARRQHSAAGANQSLKKNTELTVEEESPRATNRKMEPLGASRKNLCLSCGCIGLPLSGGLSSASAPARSHRDLFDLGERLPTFVLRCSGRLVASFPPFAQTGPQRSQRCHASPGGRRCSGSGTYWRPRSLPAGRRCRRIVGHVGSNGSCWCGCGQRLR